MPIYVWIILAVLILTLAYLGISYIFSVFLLRSHRQPVVRGPREYGMPYEDIQFKSSDGIVLKGWLIPGRSKRVAVITHPFPFNRHGFLRKHQGLVTRLKPDVDLLQTARALNRAGYYVMMFDFRNHGESGQGITGSLET